MAFYRYGSYQFEDGECDLVRTNVTNKMSPRGNRIMREVTHEIRALICADTTDALSTRIEGIQLAFSQDFQNAGLYLDASTPSRHLLANDDPFNISGTRVRQRSFPEGGGDEYSTARTFQASLYAIYDDADSQLIEWDETLEFVGTGGPIYEISNSWVGPPLITLMSERSVQTIIQRGSAIGYGAYVVPPGPLFPAAEHVERRTETYGTPQLFGRQYRMYPSSWTYYHSSIVPLTGTPNLR